MVCVSIASFYLYHLEYLYVSFLINKRNDAIQLIELSSAIARWQCFLPVCVSMCVFVNFFPDDLTVKHWCHTNDSLQEYKSVCLVVKYMSYIIMTSAMTSTGQKNRLEYENCPNWVSFYRTGWKQNIVKLVLHGKSFEYTQVSVLVSVWNIETIFGDFQIPCFAHDSFSTSDIKTKWQIA